jgi:hypothetical protein
MSQSSMDRLAKAIHTLCRTTPVYGWAGWILLLIFAAAKGSGVGAISNAPSGAGRSIELFRTSDNCMACHNGLTLSSGEDVSIGSTWRATMMANSSRDPYWQASVRRETVDHPNAVAEIEDECSVCHMPMARTQAVANGRKGHVFAHLPIADADSDEGRLAADGVSCTLCHQITPVKLGTRESFTGGYEIDRSKPMGDRPVFGPFAIDKGRTRIMHSSSEFVPTESAHIRQSELCATCHTLYTRARGPEGNVIGELPEQVPFLEWRHSAYRGERSCQSCHMPVVSEKTRIASVLGEQRDGLARHSFLGGNFFMLRMLNRFRAELGVTALPQELEAAARTTEQHLESSTATLAIDRTELAGGRLIADLTISNLTGHKLPTAYPSRRVWIRLAVRDRNGRTVFESGAVTATGRIEGNDNDADRTRAEPHYREIRRADEVQVYESIMRDSAGTVTTGLLQAVDYLKDNRLLPRGFDKATAARDIAVRGSASEDADFTGDGDRIRYTVDAAAADGPFRIDVELWYQPIGFRWAQNLAPYDTAETRRFVAYYESMSAASAHMLARASATVR